jgi:hypothetical protein
VWMGVTVVFSETIAPLYKWVKLREKCCFTNGVAVQDSNVEVLGVFAKALFLKRCICWLGVMADGD